MILIVLCVLAAVVLGFVLGRVSVGGGAPMERDLRDAKAPGWENEGRVRNEKGSLADSGRGGRCANLVEVVCDESALGVQDAAGRAATEGDHREELEGVEEGREKKHIPGRGSGQWWRGEHRGYENNGQRIWEVGSPVAGEVTECREGKRPFVVIAPGENKLYAPTGGKVIRLYPMGNAFSFVTEFGVLLHIQVGELEEELLNCHYRPRVIQNEVVNKGKLLLEFDRLALEEAGDAGTVTVRVENSLPGSRVRMLAEGRVKCGEEIFEVIE